MTSAHFTNFNLAGIEVIAFYLPDEIFAGEPIDCRVTLRNYSRKTRFDLEIGVGEEGESIPISIESGATQTTTLKLSPMYRGEVSIKRLRVSTTFPFGLFYAWKFWLYDKDFLVYPKQKRDDIALPRPDSDSINKGSRSQKKDFGADEFLGHQNFEDGMPFRGVDWKAYARGKGLLLKTFVEESDAHFILRPEIELENLNSGDALLEEELEKLSILIAKASASGLTYAVLLDGTLSRPSFGRGRDFKRHCLTQLAQYKCERRSLL